MPTNSWCGTNCPVDCDDTLIIIPDFGCETPNNEQITEIFWSNTPLTAGDLSEWNTRLSNTATATTGTIRSLKVKMDLPRVDQAFKSSQNGSRIPIETEKVASCSVEDDKDAAFNFYKTLECGMTKLFWWRSGGHIYGGLSGIYGTLGANYEINSQSDLMAHNWLLQLTYKSKCFPERTVAVI